MPKINTTSLKDATVAKKYSVSIKKNGTKPLDWELEGNLPQGISFVDSKGKFSGKPIINDKGMVRVTLSNPVGELSKVYAIKVNAILPTVKPKSLKTGTWNKNYSVLFTAKGTTPITFALSGDLPTGLTFDSSTAKLSGTPTEVCTNTPITVYASNMGGVTSKDYSLTVKGIAPKITTTKLADATISTDYTANIEATGTPTITWSATGLPAGLSIDANGQISGTPTQQGKFTVRVSAQNSAKTATKSLKLNVLATPSFGESETLASATEKKSYSHTFSVTGTTPMTFSVSGGSLPSGLTLNSSKGTLKGKPTATGDFSFTVKAENSSGSDEETFSLTVNAKGAIASSLGADSGPHDLPSGQRVRPNFSPEESEPEVALGRSEGYTIVAVLPEVSVDVEGMYDFNVTLSEDAEVGAKLMWLANSSVPDTDDEIAEFYDEQGKEI